MSAATLSILRGHAGQKGYRWYMGVGMDVIEALREAHQKERSGDIEDLSETLISILLDCHPALGISLLHIMMRDNLISFDKLIGEDDQRKSQLGKKYRHIARAVIK